MRVRVRVSRASRVFDSFETTNAQPPTRAAAPRGRGATKRPALVEAETHPRCKRPKKAANGKGAGAMGSSAAPAKAARKTVASLLPRAVAPTGFILVPDCPPLETPQQRRALVGKMLLHGWDDGVRHGWFVGRVVRSGVTPGDRVRGEFRTKQRM